MHPKAYDPMGWLSFHLSDCCGIEANRRYHAPCYPLGAILDNPREGVLTPDVYDPALNPLYRDVLAHYGVVAVGMKRSMP